jgi:hypothetical protein
MLLATLGILGAALVRFPLNFSETSAAIFMLGGTDAIIFVSVGVDTIKHHRINPAFATGIACILLFQAAAGLLAPSTAWAVALAWLVERVPGSL